MGRRTPKNWKGEKYDYKGVCRSCRAQVYWGTVVASGKKMPIDPRPAPDGPMIAWKKDDWNLCLATYDEARDGQRSRYHSHFKTCPNRETHRNNRKPRGS